VAGSAVGAAALGVARDAADARGRCPALAAAPAVATGRDETLPAGLGSNSPLGDVALA